MNNKRKILIYNDAENFGGHEVMTVEIANEISKIYDVYFIYYNPEIYNLLSPDIVSIPIKLKTKQPFALLRNFNPGDILYLKKIIEKINPDLILISQGSITMCLKGVIASKLTGIPVFSYITICFSSRIMKSKIWVLKDIFHGFIYRLFDGFITITEHQKKNVSKFLGDKNKPGIYVLENKIDFTEISKPQKDNKKDCTLNIGIIGRIDFKTKNQNRLIKIVKMLKDIRNDFKFIIIGDGPDRNRLISLIKRECLEKYFDFRGWVKEKEKIYPDLDIVFINSNYESLCLIMIEAIYRKIPVLASDCEGNVIFKDYLKSEFLFKNDKEAVIKLSNFEDYISNYNKKSETLKNYVIKRQSKEFFIQNLNSIFQEIFSII